ncbi:MAG TPA: hypothetical protein HPP66_08950 [Planctomycetes bacterium]|nr:hypothetical protein [Planctomycetota bacterium]
MKLLINLIVIIIIGFVHCFVSIRSAEAKSVYSITDHHASTLRAYKIVSDQLEYQANVDVTNYASGAVDVTIDSNLELLFITYEDAGKIVWVNAKTLQQEGFIDLSGEPCYTGSLGGIVADEQKQRVYVVGRALNRLFILAWNVNQKKLMLMDPQDPNQPYSGGDPYVTLTDLEPGTGSWGVALDENTRRLYVGNNTANVHIYDVDNNWVHLGTRDVGRTVADIEVNPNNGTHNAFLYCGALYTGPGGGHNFLVKHNLETDTNPNIEQDIGTVPIGVSVDTDTGLVYVGVSNNEIRVYDCSSYPFVQTDSENTGGGSGPAGICVPTGDVFYKPHVFDVNKVDNVNDVDCASPLISEEEHEILGIPYNWLYYNIAWDANGYADSNVVIVDYLPKEVNEPNLISDGGVYDSNEHTVTWNIGDISASDSNTFQIQVGVNYYARPGGIITNLVVMESDNYYTEAVIDTNVCCYGGNIIYVDKDANDPNSYNNGTSWDDAYIDLQDGFTGARKCDCDAIWAAEGTYKPTDDIDDTSASFELIEGVGVFGHFGGIGTYEESTSERNFADVNNETFLEGKIGENYYEAVKYIVKAEDIQDAIVDGFTIRGSYSGAGIYLDDADIAIVNCKLEDNDDYGVYATANTSSYPDIHNCLFMDNSTYGLSCNRSRPVITNSIFKGNNITKSAIFASASVIEMAECTVENHTGNSIYVSDTDIEIEDCSIRNNSNCIFCSDSNPVIKQSVIEDNAGTGIYCLSYSTLSLTNSVIRFNNDFGIYLKDTLSTTIKNNWIHNNGADGYGYYDCGISFDGQISQPLVRNNTIIDNFRYGIYSYSGTEPNVVNCILYENGTQLGTYSGEPLGNVKYSCIEGGYDGVGNISSDPLFMNPTDPNDFHIDEDSPCKDAGDPNGNYGDETDIDGEARIINGRVDMGADEYYWSPADFNRDEIVNFFDYVLFANAWQTNPADDDYTDIFDLADNNSIDYADLAVFCDEWLWEAAWDEGWMMCMGGGGMGFGLESISLENSKTALTDNRDALMLSTATESLQTRPERLAAKSQKFYDITPETTISAMQKALDAQKVDIEVSIKEVLTWLEELWLTDAEVRKMISEDEWLKFMESVIQAIKEQM